MPVTAYPSESAMTAPVETCAEAFGCTGWFAVRELDAPHGVPDIVFARFSAEAVAIRQAAPTDRSFTNRSEARVLLALHERRQSSTPELSTLTGLATGTISMVLRRLREDSVVEMLRDGWVRSHPFPSLLEAAVALELKLSDWKRGLAQAARYRAFAERSFLVLDSRRIRSAERHVASFTMNEVGLAALSVTPHVDVIRSPRRRVPYDSVARFIAGERLWDLYRHALS